MSSAVSAYMDTSTRGARGLIVGERLTLGTADGTADGLAVGITLGTALGITLGTALGITLGTALGNAFGPMLGVTDKRLPVGTVVLTDGPTEGVGRGLMVGE